MFGIKQRNYFQAILIIISSSCQVSGEWFEDVRPVSSIFNLIQTFGAEATTTESTKKPDIELKLPLKLQQYINQTVTINCI